MGGIGVVLAAALYVVIARTARRQRWNRTVLLGLSVLSGAGLVAMVVTDWPGEQLARFWADHSILAAVVSTLLLISVGYLAFEAGESAEQAKLNRSVTSAGLSGMVDHLVDIDIALSMITNQQLLPEYERDGKPLRWVRPVRERLQADGYAAAGKTAKAGSPGPPEAIVWQHDAVDQCIRRIIAGMRDWAALVSLSEDGRTVLKEFGEVRLELMQVQAEFGERRFDEVDRHVTMLRKRLQVIALGLEYISSSTYTRPGLDNFMAGAHSPSDVASIVGQMEKLAPMTVSKLVVLLRSDA